MDIFDNSVVASDMSVNDSQTLTFKDLCSNWFVVRHQQEYREYYQKLVSDGNNADAKAFFLLYHPQLDIQDPLIQNIRSYIIGFNNDDECLFRYIEKLEMLCVQSERDIRRLKGMIKRKEEESTDCERYKRVAMQWISIFALCGSCVFLVWH